MQLSQTHTDLLCTLSGWLLWETWQTMNPTGGAFTRDVGIATKTQIDYQNEAKHLSYLFAHVQQLKHFVLQLFVGFVVAVSLSVVVDDVASAAVDVVVAVCIVPILQEYLLSNTIGTIVCSCCCCCCAAVNVCCCYHCHSCLVAVAISVVVETVTLSEVKCRNVAIIRI